MTFTSVHRRIAKPSWLNFLLVMIVSALQISKKYLASFGNTVVANSPVSHRPSLRVHKGEKIYDGLMGTTAAPKEKTAIKVTRNS